MARIETGMELFASALFAGAVGVAAWVFLRSLVGEPQLRILAAAIAGGGFLLSRAVMRTASMAKSSFVAPAFDVPEFERFDCDELLLSNEDRLAPGELVLTAEDQIDEAHAEALEPLVLDDVLAKIGPDSRVVRLFDRSAMPTPGQLRSRIDDHLGHGSSGQAYDASEALSEALAELRRSLR